MTTTSNRPIPVPDERSREFFAAAKRGQLLLKKCAACGRIVAPQRETCGVCLGEQLDWTASSGKGTVFSFVFMHQLLHPAFKDEIPYNVIVVELDEGPRLTSNLVGTPNDQIRVGLRVEAVFEDVNDDVAIPKFKVVPA
jgi:uncharacterized OB-fold protein